MSILAIDIGSSRCKGVAFNLSGEILAQAQTSYSPEFPQPTFAELNAEVFWEKFQGLCRNLSAQLSHDPVEALCVSSHGETFIPVDHAGKAMGPAILNMDGRASAESVWCADTFGAKHLLETTGLIAHPMYPLPKLLWLRKHQPEIFGSGRFLAVTSYLLIRLRLPPLVDYSLASRFLAFDVMRRCWSAEILAAAGLEVDRLPIPVPTGKVAGKLNASSAKELNLQPGVLVVVGGHDQACAALGLGAIEHGRASDSAGTYECITVVSNEPHMDDAALSANLNSYCHVVPGVYLNLAYFPSGIMLEWFHNLISERQKNPSTKNDVDEQADYAWLEARAPQGPTGLCITPHLIGTCYPDFDPRARGMIWGLSPNSGRAQIYKGILEGLACELAGIVKSLEKVTGKFSDVYVTGGGTRSPLGLKLRAALTGKRFHLARCPEAVCLGGAILAAVAAKMHRSIPDAARAMVHEGAVIEPDPCETARYGEQLRRYRRLYTSVRASLLSAPSSTGEPVQ